MVDQTQAADSTRATALNMRAEADLLLQRLLSEREWIKQKNEETGKGDPMRETKGTSAIDEAIDEAGLLIERLDAAIASQRGERADVLHPVVTRTHEDVVASLTMVAKR